MNNPNDKPHSPYIPGDGSPDPLAPAESNSFIVTEHDLDDAVHSGSPKPSEENKQQDADDAVHKNYKPAPDSLHENDERDPDDAVHGK